MNLWTSFKIKQKRVALKSITYEFPTIVLNIPEGICFAPKHLFMLSSPDDNIKTKHVFLQRIEVFCFYVSQARLASRSVDIEKCEKSVREWSVWN